MKKLFSVLVLVTMVIIPLGCSKEFTCDSCGETKTGKTHTVTMLGEKVVMCDECYED